MSARATNFAATVLIVGVTVAAMFLLGAPAWALVGFGVVLWFIVFWTPCQ